MQGARSVEGPRQQGEIRLCESLSLPEQAYSNKEIPIGKKRPPEFRHRDRIRHGIDDGHSRLTSATNPESGTTTYTYPTPTSLCSGDPSTVCTRTDARSTSTTYTYNDSLNRLTKKAYSDSTPTANFFYDESSVTLGTWSSGTLANPKGRLTHTTTVNSGGTTLTATVQDYDSMGRTKDYWQCTPYNCGSSSIWSSNYVYKNTGEVAQWTHPAGYTLTNYISAARRIYQIQSSLVDTYHPQYPAQSITYMPWGALSKFVNGYAGSSGAEAQETYQYNKRLQPAVIELGTTTNQTAYSCLVYDYYGSSPTSCAVPSPGTNNNGNVMGYLYGDSVQTSFSHTATYTYDKVNRLLTAVATPFGTGTVSYNLTFNYKTPDNSNGQYGNMSCVVNGQTVGLCNNLSFNTAHNQITAYSYDAAGNVTNSTAHTYQWDAEERVSVVDPGSSPTWTFTYNALGHRVQWASSGGGEQHVFDPAGNWLGLGNPGGYTLVRFGDRHILVSTATGTNFNHINAIGSTTMMTNQGGGAAEDMQFYPWGDAWLSAGSGGYNFAYLPYRDPSTNSDFTTARVYGDDFGRWFTPDPAGKGAVQLDDPQTWNMYAYVRNNPATLTDPSGLDLFARLLNWVGEYVSTALAASMPQQTNVIRPLKPPKAPPMAELQTDMGGHTTTFYTIDGNGNLTTVQIETSNAVDHRAKPGAADPYTTHNIVGVSDRHAGDPAYGAAGAFIDTGDPRGRDIHGGGSSLGVHAFDPQQPLMPTFGCTRGHNEDVINLGNAITDFQQANPDVAIPYVRE